MEDVSYSSKDAKGNEYIVNASKGEIDYERPNVIYLTNVKAFIKLTNYNNADDYDYDDNDDYDDSG